YMEFRVDQMASNYGFDLRYTIFEPKTAKIVGTGSGYPQQPSGPISLPPIGGARTDVYIEWAGPDVARQAMKRLGWGMLLSVCSSAPQCQTIPPKGGTTNHAFHHFMTSCPRSLSINS